MQDVGYWRFEAVAGLRRQYAARFQSLSRYTHSARFY